MGEKGDGTGGEGVNFRLYIDFDVFGIVIFGSEGLIFEV